MTRPGLDDNNVLCHIDVHHELTDDPSQRFFGMLNDGFSIDHGVHSAGLRKAQLLNVARQSRLRIGPLLTSRGSEGIPATART